MAFDRYPSNALIWAADEQYSIDLVDVAVTATTKIGDVLRNNAGTWEIVDVANTANAAGVLVDEKLLAELAVGTHKLKVAVRTCTVGTDYLNYAADVDTQGEKDSINAVLLAAGIKAVAQY